MIWVLYAAESLIAGAVLTAVVALGAWLAGSPWWVWVATAVPLGFIARWGREVPVSVVTGWHGAVRRRIEER